MHPKQVEWTRMTRKRKLEVKRAYAAERGCQRCGANHPAILDFHHLAPETKHPRLKSCRPENRGRSSLWAQLSYADLLAEMEKCDILCSNCHRITEWESRQGED